MDKIAAARDNASTAIIEAASRLADRADTLASRTLERLSPVMMPEPPRDKSNRPGGEVMPTWPPMFAELRERFSIITRSLDTIENALTRTEL